MLIVIHLTETDGDIEMGCCNDKPQVEEYIADHALAPEDYAVVKGSILKGFISIEWKEGPCTSAKKI